MMLVEEGTVDGISFCLKVTRFPGLIFRRFRVTTYATGTAKSKTTTIDTFLLLYSIAVPMIKWYFLIGVTVLK